MPFKSFILFYFSNSARVFFPWIALIAVLVPMYTVTTIVNGYPFYNHFFSLFEWHAFEMLFGFCYTLMIGLLLTLGAQWNKREPISGMPLISLFFLWLIDQIVLFQAKHSFLLILTMNILGLYFLYLLNCTLKGHKEKIKFLVLIFLFSMCKNLIIWDKIKLSIIHKNLFYDFTMIIIYILNLQITTKIIPVLTTKVLKLEEDLTIPIWLKNSSQFFLILLPLSLFLDDKHSKLLIFVLAGILQIFKLYYWNFFNALKNTITSMLQIGFLMINTGLIIKGISYHSEYLSYTKASLHLILMGGISIISLNIMVILTLISANKEIKTGKRIKLIYFFILAGILIRFIVPIFYPEHFIKSLHHSMGHWTMAFLIYLIGFSHLCFKKPRLN